MFHSREETLCDVARRPYVLLAVDDHDFTRDVRYDPSPPEYIGGKCDAAHRDGPQQDKATPWGQVSAPAKVRS